MTQTLAATNGNGTQAAITKRQFDPMAPIGSPGALKALLETQKAGIAQMLPTHITPERLFKTALVAANRTADLLQCTQSSLIESINRAAELGLDVSGTLGEAYLVPFNNRVKINGVEKWFKQCQLIIGYRGFAKLARQSGEIQIIDADIVCTNDEFVLRKGSRATCEFVPNLKGDRGEIIGAYAYVKFKDGGEQFDFMTFEDIEKVRRRSKAGSDKEGEAIGAWKSDWPEMAKKTVFRRVAKWLPLSTEKFAKAVEHEHEEFDLTNILEAETRRPAVPMPRAQLAGPAAPATDPFGQPIPTAPAPASDEEAERIIQEKAAQARATEAARAQAQESGGAAVAVEEEGHEEENVAGSPCSTEAAEGADHSAGAGNAVVSTENTPTTLPDNCPVEFVVSHLLKQKPDGVTDADATARINTVLRLKLPRPWAKLTKDGKQHHWSKWQTEGFPWSDAPAAK